MTMNEGNEERDPLSTASGGVLVTEAPPFICALTIGVNEEGPFVTFENHSGKEVAIEVWPHQLEALWRSMCDQLGVAYVPPDWSKMAYDVEWGGIRGTVTPQEQEDEATTPQEQEDEATL